MSHSRLAPSKSERVLLCAASADREAVLPDEEDSAPANEGSNAHWLLEQGLAEGNWPPAMVSFGPEKLQAALPYPAFALPEELIEQAHQCYEYAQRRASEINSGGSATTALLEAESKVSPLLYTGRTDSDGTVDVTLVGDTMLEIVDLKTGGAMVEADCSQLRLYALGKMAEYADPATRAVPFTEIRLTVFQPKRPGMETIERSVSFEPQELIDWANDTWIPAAKASDSPNAKATPTTDGCKYCKARKHNTCVEYAAAMQGAAAQLFQPVKGQEVAVFDPMQSEFNVHAMTSEQIGEFLEIWPLLKARAKDIEDHAIGMLKQRTFIPGMKLVRGRSSRAWKYTDEEMKGKFKNMKLTLDQSQPRKPLSPAQFMASDLPTKTKERAKKHIINKEGALTIAPITDKRVNAVPAVEFKPVDVVAQPVAELSFLSL